MRYLEVSVLITFVVIVASGIYASFHNRVGAIDLAVPTSHPGVVLDQSFRGMATGTTLVWDNGAYIPESYPGYASVADYPDSFWVTDPQNLP
jgi:hypothetical protein